MRYEFYNFAFLAPESTTAAEAVMCAADQGMFWPYHDMLFENAGPHSNGVLNQFADLLGMDVDQFGQCLDSGQHSQDVADQMEFARALGVNSTPTIFINDSLFEQARTFEELEKTIETQLAQAN